MSKTFLGIDIGTTATRVALIREDGTLVCAASADYDTHFGVGGIAEQNPTDWNEALVLALSKVNLSSNPPDAIGLCGQTPTVVFVDSSGTPVRSALTWQDTRASLEAQELAERFGDPEPMIGTALPWSAANMPAKLLWLSRHEPSTTRQTRFLLQPKDFIGMELTESPMSDPWSSKGLCRVDDGSPAAPVLEACGWPVDSCPSTAAAWAHRGTVTSRAAAHFGLREGTPVTIGWSDALAEMLAAGCFARSSAFVFSGTSSIVGTAIDDPSVRAAGLFNVPTTCAPTALLYGPTQSGGAALTWAARLLGCGVDDLMTIASGAGPSLPVFVPYLSGERAPLWDQDVRALFVGLSAEHGRAEIAMAVVLGVLLGTRHILDLVERASGTSITQVEIAGRGVGNLLWEQAAQRSIGLTLRFHQDSDMSVRGAAMLAAALDGDDILEASHRLEDASRLALATPEDEKLARILLERYRRASDTALEWRSRDSSGLGEIT